MADADTLPAVAWRDDRDERAAAAVPVDLDRMSVVLAAALAAEGVGSRAEVTLQLVGEDAIAALNAAHLGGTGPTDVLSFALDGPDGPSDPDEPWMVGDVVVCPSLADRQAADHAGDLDSELALLVVHAALHLCGWDHATPADQAAMWARERELMESLGCSPTGDPWRPAGGDDR